LLFTLNAIGRSLNNVEGSGYSISIPLKSKYKFSILISILFCFTTAKTVFLAIMLIIVPLHENICTCIPVFIVNILIVPWFDAIAIKL